MSGRNTPVFAWLLFARDTSETPEGLFRNHINVVGDSAGLEQVCRGLFFQPVTNHHINKCRQLLYIMFSVLYTVGRAFGFIS